MNYQQTSAIAFQSFKPVTGELDLLIMEVIRNHPEGIICQDIEAIINRSHQSVSGNLRHLVENGHAKASGKFGKTKANRKAILWIEA